MRTRLLTRILLILYLLTTLAISSLPTAASSPGVTKALYPGSTSAPGSQLDTLTPTLHWTFEPGAEYYALAISKYPYGPDNIVYNPQQITGTSHTVPAGTLQPGVRYRWNLQAGSKSGWGPISNTLYFQTPPQQQSGPIIDKQLSLGPYNITDQLSLDIYNVDDVAIVQVNGVEVSRTGYYQQNELNLTPLLTPGTNVILLTIHNDHNGWTYGFRLRHNDQIVWQDEDGIVGSTGARNSDQTPGLVYQCQIHIQLTADDLDTINHLLEQAAARYGVPADLLKAIAYVESNWRHYDQHGNVLLNYEPSGQRGVGLMQVTVFPADPDYEQLMDLAYNIHQSARILRLKWDQSQRTNPTGAPADDPGLIENWWYATVYYNGAGVSSLGFTGVQYAEKVRQVLLHPPQRIRRYITSNLGWTFPYDVVPGFQLFDYISAREDGTFLYLPQGGSWNQVQTYHGPVHRWQETAAVPPRHKLEIQVVVSNLLIMLDRPPAIIDGRTLLPFRAIAEALGAVVGWNTPTRTVTISRGDTHVRLQIGDLIGYVNDEPIPLDVPAQIIDGFTMIPVRFLAESLGVSVDWDSSSRRVFVNSTVYDTTDPTPEQWFFRTVAGYKGQNLQAFITDNQPYFQNNNMWDGLGAQLNDPESFRCVAFMGIPAAGQCKALVNFYVYYLLDLNNWLALDRDVIASGLRLRDGSGQSIIRLQRSDYQADALVKAGIRRGDVFFIYVNPAEGWGHYGIVYDVQGSTVLVVDANRGLDGRIRITTFDEMMSALGHSWPWLEIVRFY